MRPWSIPGALPPHRIIGWAHVTTGLHTREIAAFYELYEIYGAAKGIYQAYWVDDEERSLTDLDIPTVGGGAQIGIHYAWSGATPVSEW